MNLRYSWLEKITKRIYRRFLPIPKSPYTIGYTEDICAINLVPPEDLEQFFSNCIKILQRIKGKVVGDYLEFGVFNGASLSSMHLTCKKLQIKSTRLFGFDAFEGLPAGSENEDGGVWKKGFYSCSFDQMTECLKRKNIDPNDVTWIKGWYDKTLTSETAKLHSITKLGIVFVDCDTYSSSKTVLDFIKPLITEEFIICFDDWKLNDLDLKGMGEYKSFNEFLEANPGIKVREIKSYNRKSRSFLVKPGIIATT